MKASAWLWAALGVSLLCGGVALLIGLVPLLVRPEGAYDASSFDLDITCLFWPTRSDWAAHLISYFILGLLLLKLSQALSGFTTQLLRTRRALHALLSLAQPLDGDLRQMIGALGLGSKVDLVRSATPLAFCYGLFRPRICLSTGMVALLEPQELNALLLHERWHMLRRDPLKVAIGRAWAASFCFLPVGRDLYARYLIAKEIEADRYAAQQLGGNDALIDALCVLAERADTRSGQRSSLATAGSADELDTRLAGLLGQPQQLVLPVKRVLISALLLICMVAVQWTLAQAAVGNALWQLQHSALGGC